MKQHLINLVPAFLVIGIFSALLSACNADDDKAKVYVYENAYSYEDEPEKQAICEDVVNWFDENSSYVEIKSIAVNADGGTEVEGDYVVLVRCNWTSENGVDVAKSKLLKYSNSLATHLSRTQSVEEVAVFWDATDSGLKGKCAYERYGTDLELTSKVCL